MPRIAGVDIPENKRMDVALAYVYGIGPTLARKILEETGIPLEKKAKDLTDHEITAISHVISERHPVEGDLKRIEAANIKRHMIIGTYRGSRHKKSLPVRGQRTKTNARTRKGPRKTVGAFKDKAVRKAVAGPATGAPAA
ncbi:MAG: 30S ribosomal protein S13 [Candidatus Omnitrophica bacterium]|nr:30S ribosomal protein S13 [Candidatus Omnitrophota bacterium]